MLQTIFVHYTLFGYSVILQICQYFVELYNNEHLFVNYLVEIPNWLTISLKIILWQWKHCAMHQVWQIMGDISTKGSIINIYIKHVSKQERIFIVSYNNNKTIILIFGHYCISYFSFIQIVANKPRNVTAR